MAQHKHSMEAGQSLTAVPWWHHGTI
jgi:hypothetical protein